MCFFFRRKSKKTVETTQILPFDSLHKAVVLIDATAPGWEQAGIKASVFYKVYGIKGNTWFVHTAKRKKDEVVATPADKTILREDIKWRRGLPATDKLKALLEDTPDVLISLFSDKNPLAEKLFKRAGAGYKVARAASYSDLANVLVEDAPDRDYSMEESLDFIVKFIKKFKQ